MRCARMPRSISAMCARASRRRAADLIVLPGSKSVQRDLAWLRENGWDRAIERHLRYGGKVLGICGGMQMLGRDDRRSGWRRRRGGSRERARLARSFDVLTPHKQLENVAGRLTLGDARAPVRGYEIHMGRTHGAALARPARRAGSTDASTAPSPTTVRSPRPICTASSIRPKPAPRYSHGRA